MRINLLTFSAMFFCFYSSCSTKPNKSNEEKIYRYSVIDTPSNRSFRLLRFIEDEVVQPLPSDYDFYVVFRSHKWQRNQTIYTIKSYDSIVMITYKEIETNKDDEPLYDSLEKRSIEGIDFKYTTKNKLININSIKGLMDTIVQSTKNLHSYQAVGMHDNYSMHVFINGKDYSVLAEYANGETMLRLDAAFTRSNAFNDLINGK